MEDYSDAYGEAEDAVFPEGGNRVDKIQEMKLSVLEDMLRSDPRGAFAGTQRAVSVPQTDDRYIHAERPDRYTRDSFCNSEFVFGLSECTYRPFIDGKDVSLVFFYNNENDEKVVYARQQIKKAARASKKANHAYGVVNCNLYPDICQTEGVCSYPMYKFFSRGKPLSTVYDTCNFSSDIIKKFVETAPVSECQ